MATEQDLLPVLLSIPTCGQCPFVDHSGAFTPGGAKPICSHKKAAETFGPPLPVGATENQTREHYHWKHRVVDRSAAPPPQCPIRTRSTTSDYRRGVDVAVKAFDAEIARQAEFGMYPSAEDFRIAFAALLTTEVQGARCTCGHHCPSREEWMNGAQCVHADDCELMRGAPPVDAVVDEERDG